MDAMLTGTMKEAGNERPMSQGFYFLYPVLLLRNHPPFPDNAPSLFLPLLPPPALDFLLFPHLPPYFLLLCLQPFRRSTDGMTSTEKPGSISDLQKESNVSLTGVWEGEIFRVEEISIFILDM